MTPNEHRPDDSFSPMRRARSRRTIPLLPFDVGVVLGYAVSAVMLGVGALVLAGYLVHEGVPDQFRWTFGIVLILMGVYRFFMTQVRRQRRQSEQDEDEE